MAVVAFEVAVPLALWVARTATPSAAPFAVVGATVAELASERQRGCCLKTRSPDGTRRLSYRDMPVPVRPGASAAFPGNAVQKNAVTKKDLARKSIK